MKITVSHLLVFITLTFFSFSYGCSSKEELKNHAAVERPIKAVQLMSSENTNVFVFPAIAKPKREVDLSFMVGGSILELDLTVGQKVKKGELLARIDPRDFYLNIRGLEAALKASKAQLEECSLRYNRFCELLKQGSIPKAEYDTVRAAYLTAVAQVDANLENLNNGNNLLKDTYLKAPFDGYISQRKVEEYEIVGKGQKIISIIDLSKLEVEFGLPEKLFKQILNFQSFKVVFDTFPKNSFCAKFKEISRQASQSGTYPVSLVLEERANHFIQPGMIAKVFANSIFPEDDNPQFIIPIQSLFNKGGDGSLVWIFDPKNNTVREQAVIVEDLTFEGARISGNIVKGQWIVTSGVHHLHEGQKVRLLEANSETNVVLGNKSYEDS